MWGIASAWLPIFYHAHISVFLFLDRFTSLVSKSQRSGGNFSHLQNATQQHDCLVLCWYHYHRTPHLQCWNSLLGFEPGCQQAMLSQCQPLCTHCKPGCSSLSSRAHGCCLPRLSRHPSGQHWLKPLNS